MKILHTADWHIGKILHKHPLSDELNLFFDWLLDLIEKEQIDLLLISGDIFDLANPAVKDRTLYYSFLNRLIKLQTKVIITGGNHDAVGLLNAPNQILDNLNIHVVGGATNDIEDELIQIKNDNDQLELVVAAVPFLRDKDLRSKEKDSKYSNRTEAIREGIKEHYQTLASICEKKYKSIPVIAMGHLYARGAINSESERDIHVGNAAAIEASIFSKTFDYVALGHIHRPQIIGKNEFIRYSGSPIPLSFSEKDDSKSIVLLELEKGKIKKPSIIEIPKSRALLKLSGELNTIKEKIALLKSDFPLVSFLEIEVKEKLFNALTLAKAEDLATEYQDSKEIKILKIRSYFEEGAKDTSQLFIEGEHIEDLKPNDVFKTMLDQQEIEEEQQEELLSAFTEIIENLNQST